MEWKQVEKGEYQQHRVSVNTTRSRDRYQWRRPQPGWYKCNTDGSFVNADTTSSAGWIIRDSEGVYKGSVQAK